MASGTDEASGWNAAACFTHKYANEEKMFVEDPFNAFPTFKCLFLESKRHLTTKVVLMPVVRARYKQSAYRFSN